MKGKGREIEAKARNWSRIQPQKQPRIGKKSSMELSEVAWEEEEEEEEEEDEEEEEFQEEEEEEFQDEETGTQEEGPSWADMLPDALAKIFSRLSLEEMLMNIPRVCRTWKRVSQDAACWQRVDLDEWSRSKGQETVERMVVLLLNRSRGCLRELCVPSLHSDSLLRLIAWSGSLLQVLRIPNSLVTEDCVCQLTSKFPSITYLDLSGCAALSKASIESFGKNCRLITRLNLNMYPPPNPTAVASDDIAFAIAHHMPRLKHLEMVYGMLSNTGLKALLEKCTNLECLDLRGCWHLNIEESFVKEARKRFKVFHEPVVENDIYNTDDSDLDASDYYDDSDMELWEDSEFDDVDDLMMDMHEEEINGTLYFWPDTSPSP